MRLKVPILMAGATLAGATAHAEEPVTIEPIDGEFDITFAASGTRLRLGADIVHAVWNDTDKSPHDDGKTTTDLRVDASGLTAVLTGSAGYATLTGVTGGLDLDIADGPRPGCDADGILGLTVTDDGLVVRDCRSGGEVTVGLDRFKVEIEGFMQEVVAELDPGKLDFPDTRLRVAMVTGGDSAGGVDVRDVDLATLRIAGRSTAGRIEGSSVDDLAFSGDHKGVTIGNSDIVRLGATGVFTGAMLPGTTVVAYDGPGTFRVDERDWLKK